MIYLRLIVLFFFVTIAAVQGQLLQPVKWSYALEPNTPVAIGDEVDITFEATIDQGWYLYSSDFDPELGPLVTTFTFTPDQAYALVGGIVPLNPKKKYDDLWEGEYTYFKGKGKFRQRIKVLAANPSIAALMEGQTCADETGKCIPLEEEFAIRIPTQAATPRPAPSTEPDTIKKEKEEEAPAPVPIPEEGEKKNDRPEEEQETQKAQIQVGQTLQAEEQRNDSLWGFMLLAFVSGLAALLTPCVFPMIPMTVSFFTGKGKNPRKGIGRALFYGASIIAIYTGIGLVFSSVFGADAANILSTHWLPNVIFFAVFLIFAISFFGAFDIVLPSGLVNSVDKQADKGGLVGIFFMALTLAVVSFSCTGPIAGTILFQSATGEFLKPALGMFSFSLAFALPFTLFALFPSWLDTLPKSGGWLNTVKVVLGFVELALAFKFLSVADQVYHWGILDRPIYIAIWMAISIAMGLYLLGVYRLPHDSIEEKIGVNRLLLAIGTFIFAIYLLPGMFGAPLKALSGYLPPQSTHDFDLRQMIRQELGTIQAVAPTENLDETPKYADFLHLPHGLKGYFDLEQALQAAQRLNKPVFIDFTGHGCVNCREMEASVWADPHVLQRLREEYVVVALYVDDRTELPEKEWVTSSFDGKIKKTIGKKNADIQITYFQKNAQPYYVLMAPTGEVLTTPKGYDLNPENFVRFLDAGLEAFQSR
ncbi:MAG: cytochrome c biogenesis protein CcdA [Bernardetiaceae bacterium]